MRLRWKSWGSTHAWTSIPLALAGFFPIVRVWGVEEFLVGGCRPPFAPHEPRDMYSMSLASAFVIMLVACIAGMQKRPLRFALTYSLLAPGVGAGMGIGVLAWKNSGGAQILTPTLVILSIVFALAAWSGWAVGAASPREETYDGERCGRCAYDMRGLPEAVCPECGWDARRLRTSIPEHVLARGSLRPVSASGLDAPTPGQNALALGLGLSHLAVGVIVSTMATVPYRHRDLAGVGIALFFFALMNLFLSYAAESRLRAGWTFAFPSVAIFGAYGLLGVLVVLYDVASTRSAPDPEAAFLLLAVAPFAACAAGVRRGRVVWMRRLAADHRCLDCGYSLDGLTSDVCPECGRESS